MDRSRSDTLLTASGAFLMLLLMCADMFIGDAGGDPCEIFKGLFTGEGPLGEILWKVRIPRIITAVIAGSALAVSGMQMQGIFRNPLADPHIMGVSSGAGFGAAVGTLLLSYSGTGIILGDTASWASAASGLTIAAAAFLGAILSSALIILVSTRIQSATTLLIFGVMLGFIFNALTSILEYSADQESLKLFYNWSSGSFSGSRTGEIWIMLGALLAGLGIAAYNNKGLDIVLFGDEYAGLVGAKVSRIRVLAMISCCIMTGAVTAFCGPLGFVGIVSPHIARKILGTSVHRSILPESLLVGAILSISADIISQAATVPLPIGSTMALIGIPIILVILLRKE